MQKPERPSKDDFLHVMQIAEFAAQRSEDRRQYEFKIFISYATLLILAIWKHDIIGDISQDKVVIGSIIILHIFYIIWTISLSVTMQNDGNRRNFYLKKAEDISHLLLEKLGPPLNEKMDTEYKRENNRKDNPIKTVPTMFSAWKHLNQFGINYAATFQIILPTIMVLILILLLLKK